MNKIKEFYNKYRKSIITPTAVMVCICIVVALALSFTNELTSPKSEKITGQNQQKSMATVLKAEKYTKSTLNFEGKQVDYYIAKTDNKILGYIFITEENGYGGSVSVMTAIKPDANIKSVYILDVSDETPGLGKNAANKDFYSQFSGLSDKISVIKDNPDKDKNEIKALSGATITSKAVTRAVNKALSYADCILSADTFTYVKEENFNEY